MFIAFIIIMIVVMLIIGAQQKKQKRREERIERRRERKEERRQRAYERKQERTWYREEKAREKREWKRKVAENKRAEKVRAREEEVYYRRQLEREEVARRNTETKRKLEEEAYYRSQFERNEAARQRAKEAVDERYKAFEFSDGISEEEFSDIIYLVKKTNKRLKVLMCDGPKVYGEVESLSKQSTWSFYIDFNTNGHINNGYRLWQDNDDSNIPKVCAECIKNQINRVIDEKRQRYYEQQYEQQYRQQQYQQQHETAYRVLNYCPSCGNNISDNTGRFCRYCGTRLRQ